MVFGYFPCSWLIFPTSLPYLPILTYFTQFYAKHWTIFGASCRLQYVMKIYLLLAWNNREEIRGKEFSTKTYKIAYSPSQEGWRGDGEKTRLRSWKLLSFLSLRITWGLYVGIKFGKIDIAHLVCKLQAKVWNVPFFHLKFNFQT